MQQTSLLPSLLPSTIQIDLPPLPRPALPSWLRAHAIEYDDRPTLNYPRSPPREPGGLGEISMRLRGEFPQLGVRFSVGHAPRLYELCDRATLAVASRRAQAILLALAVATVGGGAVSTLHVEAGAARPASLASFCLMLQRGVKDGGSGGGNVLHPAGGGGRTRARQSERPG